MADLEKEDLMFVAARGGAGGKGNHFFITDTEQAPKICEYGAEGENIKYTIELKTMAHIGLVRIEINIFVKFHFQILTLKKVLRHEICLSQYDFNVLFRLVSPMLVKVPY